jgi:hypothetical protein
LEVHGEKVVECSSLYQELEGIKEKREVSDLVFHNVISMYHKLSHNSPIRRSLLYNLSEGFSISQTQALFNVSESIVKKARKERGKAVFELKYKSGVKRLPLTEDENKMLMSVIDDLLPTVSERD